MCFYVDTLASPLVISHQHFSSTTITRLYLVFHDFSMYFARHLPSSDMTLTSTPPQHFPRYFLMHHHPNYPSSPVRGCHHTLGVSTSISEDPLEKFREKDYRGDMLVMLVMDIMIE